MVENEELRQQDDGLQEEDQQTSDYHRPSHLAWHETLELHELVAFQSGALIKLKKSIRRVTDPALRSLYAYSIQAIEGNLKELLPFFSYAPSVSSDHHYMDENPFYAGDLLALAKTAVRNYAIAITETATPLLRKVLMKQLHGAVEWHGKVFYYMYQRSYYPSYNLQKLLEGDVARAQQAIAMRY
jgi:spore coat protein F